MKINFILGSALLLSQPLCAQNEEAKDTLTAQMMMQNLPEVFVKATRSYRQGRKRTVGLQYATAHRENAGRQRL